MSLMLILVILQAGTEHSNWAYHYVLSGMYGDEFFFLLFKLGAIKDRNEVIQRGLIILMRNE